MAVVTADELEHLVAPGDRAGKAQGAHGRFGSGIDHAHHVHAGEGFHNFPRKKNLVGAGRSVAGSLRRRGRHRFCDFRVGVPEQKRTPRQNVVNERVAVHGGDMTPLPRGNEQGIAADSPAGAHRAVHPARNVA